MPLKWLEHAAEVDLSDLAGKMFFIGLKAEVDKLGINKMANVTFSLIHLKTKVDKSDVGEFKELKNLGDVVKNEVVKNKKQKTFKTKVNKLEKKSWCDYINFNISIQQR